MTRIRFRTLVSQKIRFERYVELIGDKTRRVLDLGSVRRLGRRFKRT